MNNSVYSVSMHPDGKRVAAGMGSDAVVISIGTGDTLCRLGNHGGTVRTVAYNPSGKRIATGETERSCAPNCANREYEGCDDRQLRIFESEKGALLFGPFELHSDWIRSLAWSPDGQRYAFRVIVVFLVMLVQNRYRFRR